MSNKEQFNHNINKAQRQRTAELNLLYKEINNIRSQLQNNYDNLIDYIDFKKICKDFKLRAGDLTPNQQGNIEQILKEFIKQNSSFYEI